MKIIRNTKIKVTNENTTELRENEVFVFGSNLAGIHGGGAAKFAKDKFGAVQGVGEGLTGKCYALPTKDKNIETLSLNEIHKSVEVLLEVVKNSNSFFIITAVGCGLAGYDAKDIAPMFEPFIHLNNISLPQSFIDIIFPPKIVGYKVTDKNMKCRDVQFTMNKKHSVEGDIIICNNGFHFCKELKDCFNYYTFTPENRVFLVEGTGNYDFNEDKIAVMEIKFVKELNWYEVLDKVNSGIGNSGLSNSGDYNSGDYNSGDRNSGDYNSGYYNSGDYNSGNRNSGYYNSGDYNSGNRNSGDRNSGYYNSGNRNSGDYNSGYYNSGNRNSGDRNSGYYNSGNRNSGYYNSGDYNSGNRNSGYYNSGDYNSGNRNSGDRNSGYYNSGNRNSGDRNSGYYNSGDRNSGYYNSGNRNSGYYNSGDYNSGYYNSDEPNARLFNKNTKIKVSEIKLPYVEMPTTKWVSESEMTENEKRNNPKFFVTQGYLKTIPYKEAFKIMWDNNRHFREATLVLPNFNAEVFEKITGIKI